MVVGIDDTDAMWMLFRAIAIAVLAVVGLLLAAQGAWLFEAVDRGLEAVGTGVRLPRADPTRSTPVAAGGLVLGALVALISPTRRAVSQLVTLLHELGHTVVAAALGARPSGIVLRHDASGHATARWVGTPTPWRRVALATVAFAGLPAAATASTAGARLLVLAGPQAVLWSFAAAGVVVAMLARSAWSLLVAGSLAGLAALALSEAGQPFAAGAVIALLTATAVRVVSDTGRSIGRPIDEGSDARAVAGPLFLPARLVQCVQVAVAAALSVWTLWLLFPSTSSLAQPSWPSWPS